MTELENMPIDHQGLECLDKMVTEALEFLCFPGKPWIPLREQAGKAVEDVVIIGGGMVGMLAWFALRSMGVERLRILDQSKPGHEGPWLSYARMQTLRSPKQLTGPAFGHGLLTFQAWYRAQFGAADWQGLDKIPRPMWMDYLKWYRKVLQIPVENGKCVDLIEPDGDLLRLTQSGTRSDTILTRKVVMATGRDGTGKPNIPDFAKGLPLNLWAHSADDINFNALRNKRVAVIGVGASAVDNAAEALEHGASEVRLLIRRQDMPIVNKMMGIGSAGFTAGFAAMPDEWRWRFMNYSFSTQTPAPHGSTKRVSRHDNAFFHFGKTTVRTEAEAEGVRIHFADGESYKADFMILGTGFLTDPMSRTEFGKTAGRIQLWRDMYTPPAGEENADLGRFPYLNPDFTFREKIAGTDPWLRHVYCFNYGATASLGKVSGDIPGISDGAAWLSRSLSAALYAEDIKAHWQNFMDYDTPELDGSEWKASKLPQEIDA